MVCWSLAAVTLLPEETWLSRGVFFLGLGLTFLLVYLLPKAEGRMKWALYPAGALLLVGLLASIGASNWIKFIGQLRSSLGGIVLLFLAIRKKACMAFDNINKSIPPLYLGNAFYLQMWITNQQ